MLIDMVLDEKHPYAPLYRFSREQGLIHHTEISLGSYIDINIMLCGRKVYMPCFETYPLKHKITLILIIDVMQINFELCIHSAFFHERTVRSNNRQSLLTVGITLITE